VTGSSPSARFTDGKEPGALRTIGEVADALGIRQHVLRYWEQQFPMLRPLKRSGGRRYYRPEDVVLVERIDRLVNREGYTLRGARQALEAGTAGAPAGASPAAPPKVAAADLLPQLRAIRSRLAQALQA
jgi:DNA-binding transcriptional MerR regulator